MTIAELIERLYAVPRDAVVMIPDGPHDGAGGRAIAPARAVVAAHAERGPIVILDVEVTASNAVDWFAESKEISTPRPDRNVPVQYLGRPLSVDPGFAAELRRERDMNAPYLFAPTGRTYFPEERNSPADTPTCNVDFGPIPAPLAQFLSGILPPACRLLGAMASVNGCEIQYELDGRRWRQRIDVCGHAEEIPS